MATKRTQRIDPNAAFAAIVGAPQDTEENTATVAPPPQETRAGEGSGPTTEAPAKKLVQKGYYLTEEQVRQLGIFAVMNGVDRSSIVRDALDAWFEAHAGQGLPL